MKPNRYASMHNLGALVRRYDGNEVIDANTFLSMCRAIGARHDRLGDVIAVTYDGDAAVVRALNYDRVRRELQRRFGQVHMTIDRGPDEYVILNDAMSALFLVVFGSDPGVGDFADPRVAQQKRAQFIAKAINARNP